MLSDLVRPRVEMQSDPATMSPSATPTQAYSAGISSRAGSSRIPGSDSWPLPVPACLACMRHPDPLVRDPDAAHCTRTGPAQGSDKPANGELAALRGLSRKCVRYPPRCRLGGSPHAGRYCTVFTRNVRSNGDGRLGLGLGPEEGGGRREVRVGRPGRQWRMPRTTRCTYLAVLSRLDGRTIPSVVHNR